MIRQTIWEAYQQGILAPTPSKREMVGSVIGQYLDFDRCMITAHGIQVLNSTSDQIQVYDPQGYLLVFWSDSSSPDTEMMRYLTECIKVFQHHHLLATIVLLGSASERLLEVLANDVQTALGTDGAQWFTSYSKKSRITDKFDFMDGKLRQVFGGQLDNRDLVTIRLSFEQIRQIRNDVVHEHNRHPTWNEVAGLLHTFVLYFRSVQRVRGKLCVKTS